MRETVPPYLSHSYRTVAHLLADYVQKLGFTHVEFLPLTEHPFYGSWGYQATGFFAATSRYGTPQDLMYLIDTLHQRGVGVILDWVPSHFATDDWALGTFDGTHLYEHADPRQGYHPDWGSYIFNYDRHEVRSFLMSSALFWLDKYHVDGIRVDAVASMLYLDYSRKEGEWVPNRHGGKENVGAIEFLKRFNHEVYTHYPDVQTVAEESTSWPMVSRPAYLGGLGFGYKWDMGWMHDSLKLPGSRDPVVRKYHQNDLTFRQLYANTENYVLPLSHDEVVHGKGSLYGKMAGDEWQKFANLRLLLAYQYGMTGKKAALHGRRTRPADRVAARRPAPLGEPRQPAAPRRPAARLRPEQALPRRPRAARTRLRAGRLRVDRLHGRRQQPDQLRPAPALRPRAGRRPLQLHAGAAAQLSRRRAGAGHLDGGSEHRRGIYGGGNVGNAGRLHAEFVSCHGRPYSLSVTLPPLAALFFRGRV